MRQGRAGRYASVKSREPAGSHHQRQHMPGRDVALGRILICPPP
jgi:hypothetical protein